MSSLFFAPWCPDGGNFYVCTTGARFVGCCKFNPCNDHGCGWTDLRLAGFDPRKHRMFSDQTCDGNNPERWYTCTGTNPPFMGCCMTDPCSGGVGCPSQMLIAGRLSSDSVSAADFLGATSLISTAALGVAKPANNSVTGVSVVGGIVFLALIICLLIWWTHRRTSASRLSHVMNRARCAEQAIREMATENTGPTGTFSKINSPRDSYRSILNPIFPIHATQLIYQYRSQLPTLFYSIWPK